MRQLGTDYRRLWLRRIFYIGAEKNTVYLFSLPGGIQAPALIIHGDVGKYGIGARSEYQAQGLEFGMISHTTGKNHPVTVYVKAILFNYSYYHQRISIGTRQGKGKGVTGRGIVQCSCCKLHLQ